MYQTGRMKRCQMNKRYPAYITRMYLVSNDDRAQVAVFAVFRENL